MKENDKGEHSMTKDMTTGKIMPMLVQFTVPLVLGNLFQLTYNAVDSIIVGHFVGKEALAAGGSWQPPTPIFSTDCAWEQPSLWERSTEPGIMIRFTGRSVQP